MPRKADKLAICVKSTDLLNALAFFSSLAELKDRAFYHLNEALEKKKKTTVHLRKFRKKGKSYPYSFICKKSCWHCQKLKGCLKRLKASWITPF